MKRFGMVIFVSMLMLFSIFLPVFAQVEEDVVLDQTHTESSVNFGTLTFDYPEDWFVSGSLDVDGIVLISNVEDAITIEDSPETGFVGIGVSFIPDAVLGRVGLEEGTVFEVLDLFIEFASEGEDAPTFDEPSEIEIGELVGAQTTGESVDGDARMIAVELEDAFVLLVVATGNDEIEESEDIVLAIAESLEYSTDVPEMPTDIIELPSAYEGIPQFRLEDGGFVIGAEDAPIAIVAFEDFLCPHCQNYKPIVDQIIAEYVATGQAQFEYRILPVIDETLSVFAGALAVCSDQLGSTFWDAHDLLFEIASSEQFGQQSISRFVEEIGIPADSFRACVDTVDQVWVDRELAIALEVTGTPTVFVRYGVDGEYIRADGQDFDTLASLIEEANQ